MINVDQEKLVKMWKTYINDSSLFTKQKFGAYLHDKIVERGYAWPKLYYAGREAYDIVWAYIHKGNDEGIRRLQ